MSPHFRTPPVIAISFLSLFIMFLFFYSLEHNLRDCRSIMEFTVVDCMSPASDVETPQSTTVNLSRISCPYLINIVINDGCIVLNTAWLCIDSAGPRTSVVVVEFYFLIIGRKIYSSVPSVRCIGLRVHVLDHTHTHISACINQKGFNSTCHWNAYPKLHGSTFGIIKKNVIKINKRWILIFGRRFVENINII